MNFRMKKKSGRQDSNFAFYTPSGANYLAKIRTDNQHYAKLNIARWFNFT